MNKFDEMIAEGLAEIEKSGETSLIKIQQILDTLMQIALDKTSNIIQGISAVEIPFIGAALMMTVDTLKSHQIGIMDEIESLYDLYSNRLRSVMIEIPRSKNGQKRSGQDE